MNDPLDPRVQLAQAGAALAAGNPAAALAAFDRVIARQPLLPNAHAGRGMALASLGVDDAAIAALRRALTIDPVGASAVGVQIGYLFLQMGRPASAHATFGWVLAAQPELPQARQGEAVSLLASSRFEEALPRLAALRDAAPAIDYLTGVAFHARLQIADWDDYVATTATLAAGVRRGERVDTPLTFIVHNSSAPEQRRCAATYAADRCAAERPVQRRVLAAASRLRVAYLSSDLRDHAVAQSMIGVFDAHDRDRFEVHALSSGPDDGSELRRRIVRSVEHVVDVASWSDEAVATWIGDRGIDVVVDLGGHSLGGRTHVLAFRPAPVQVSLLGFPGTLGTAYVDYIVADEVVIPPEQREHYSEQVIQLPDSFFPASAPPESGPPGDRHTAGLPPEGVVFCCFNGVHKISPRLFDSWMRILAAVPGGVLWLRDGPPRMRANLSREAAQRRIDPKRLLFAERMPSRADHHARFAAADLFLDTAPYGAHTTAAEALGVGVPVITLCGATFASRVAASLLTSVGLPQLAVRTADQYERLAIDLASNPAALAALKMLLRGTRDASPLFDPGRYTRHLEAAYTTAVARHRRGEAPSPLTVPRLQGG